MDLSHLTCLSPFPMWFGKLSCSSLVLIFAVAACAPFGPEVHENDLAPGMVFIPGGTFQRGAPHSGEYDREYPAHSVSVNGFYIDSCEVTNAQFATFVEATGYTTVAEKAIDWESLRKQLPPRTPKPPDSLLAPGSLVFAPPTEGVDLSTHMQWWAWKQGASWKNPDGGDVSISTRMDHPVVQVAYADAEAYCAWRGGRLPTEAEWEYAARGGLEGKRFVWGDEDPLVHVHLANIWQGQFPENDEGKDGYAGTAPVGSFPPNGFGLYDMAGNVWEWCSDLFHPYHYQALDCKKVCHNPQGPAQSHDPREPFAGPKRVIKGGSYLCHVSYCENYRPSAREGSAEDTGLPHLGFRCVIDRE